MPKATVTSRTMYRSRRGQSLVELAMVFPFFLLIIIGGIIDFGFALHNVITLQQLTNDAAQWGAEKNHSDEEIIAFINSRKPTSFKGSFTVMCPQRTKLASGGQVIKICLSYDSPAYTPFYKAMLKGTTGNDSIRISALAAYKIPDYFSPTLATGVSYEK